MTGEIVEVDLGDPIGHESGFLRPALVVSSPGLHVSPLRIVCPITRTPRPYPYRVEVEAGARNGLASTSYVQVEHVRSVSTDRILRTLGTLDYAPLMRVQRILQMLFDLP